MTLSFKTEVEGVPTYFVEKVLKGIMGNSDPMDPNIKAAYEKGHIDIASYACSMPKVHTIREDRSDRWRPGKKIHFVINNRSAHRLQFAPERRCISVQRIKINASMQFVSVEKKDGDWKILSPFQLRQLAVNDGFDNVKDFWKWFNNDFEGKRIHWTHLSYG